MNSLSFSISSRWLYISGLILCLMCFDCGAVGATRDFAVSLRERFPSLSAAQVVCPDAASLDDAYDWCLLQALLDSDQSEIVLKRRSYFIGSRSLLVRRDGVRIKGAGMGDSTGGGTRIVVSSDVEVFVVTARYAAISYLQLESLYPMYSKRHLSTRGAIALLVDSVRFDAMDAKGATGGGLALGGSGDADDQGSMATLRNIIVNHGSIDVKTWDVHISDCWIWALSRPYGLLIEGSIGNFSAVNLDVVPPFLGNPLGIAGIVIRGPVAQPMFSNVYLDGNPSLRTGVGILAENGVIGLTISNLRANSMSAPSIILDSVIFPSILNATIFNGDKFNEGHSDIVIRKSFSQEMVAPTVLSSHLRTLHPRSVGTSPVLIGKHRTTDDWRIEAVYQFRGVQGSLFAVGGRSSGLSRY